MTVTEVIISAAITGASGVAVWFIKDKKKSDADHLALIIEQLSKQVERLDKQVEMMDKQNQTLEKIITAEKEEKRRVVVARDERLEKVHQLEITDQKKSNQITLLILQQNKPGESENNNPY